MDDRKDKTLLIRLSADEKASLISRADDVKLSVSEYVRQSIFTTRVNVTLKHFTSTKEASDIIYHLSRIGNNLNQIAHYLNGGNAFDTNTKKELLLLMKKLQDLLSLINDFMEKTYGNS